MTASMTQDILVKRKESSRYATLCRTLSTLEPEEFNNYIQQEYGAYWGTLKFEDSLSDYSNEVKNTN